MQVLAPIGVPAVILVLQQHGIVSSSPRLAYFALAAGLVRCCCACRVPFATTRVTVCDYFTVCGDFVDNRMRVCVCTCFDVWSARVNACSLVDSALGPWR